MRINILSVLAALLAVTSADFFVSNTSICMGSDPLAQCYHGVKVLSNVANDTKEAPYTCQHLMHAEDNNYIRNGTMGPGAGDPFVSSPGGICNSGQLDFVKDGGKNGSYTVKDKEGKSVGDCLPEPDHSEHHPANATCSVWIGMFYFSIAFKCKSHICG